VLGFESRLLNRFRKPLTRVRARETLTAFRKRMSIVMTNKKLGVTAVLLFVTAFVLLWTGALPSGGSEPGLEVAIIGGRVMDPESGLDAVRNVGIRGGKIVAVTADPLTAKATIDAEGLVVAPGFIDLHQHGQDAENYDVKVADGVTTGLEMEVGVADIDAWYGAREGKARINFGASVGHIPARIAVMHDPSPFLPSADAAHRAATPAEIEQMKEILDKGLQRGALGVGLGPAYTFAATNWEILEMFRTAAKHHAPCHVHIRALPSDKEGDISGFQEVMADAAITGAPLHIVHLQSTGGPNVVHELQIIEEAQKHGMDVTTECYPYSRGMTDISSAIFDHKENEPNSYFASLLWPATGEMLTRETFLKYRKTGGMVILPSNTEENVRAAVISPLTMIASDGRLEQGKGHPRTAGTYAKVLGEYVRRDHAIDLMTALRKMTIMPAKRLEARAPVFQSKGRIKAGADADIVVFDPLTITDHSTYAKPNELSSGFAFVLVNGVAVVRSGKLVDNVYPGLGARAPVETSSN
jgi:N-acyl-D-aspartate/D-glutamate deacylase